MSQTGEGFATARAAPRHGGAERLLTALDAPGFLPVCFGLYIALRLALLVLVPVTQTSDFAWYTARGLELAATGRYAQDGALTAFWPVGWPGLLGALFRLFGPHPLVGQLANLVLSAFVFGLVARVGTRLFGDRRVGRLAVLILAIYPNQIAYVPLLSVEIFYAFLMLLAIDLLTRHRAAWCFVAGLVFGVATLTKAQTLPLPALLLCATWLLDQTRRVRLLRPLCLVYLGLLLVVAPWTARNYAVFHAVIPVSTNGGFTLLTGNNPSATGDYDPKDKLVAGLSGPGGNEVLRDHIARARAIDWIEHNPGRFAELVPLKIWRLWAPDGEGEWFYQAGYAGYDANYRWFRAVRGLNQAYYVLILVLAAGFLWATMRGGVAVASPWAFAGWSLVGFFTLVSIAFSGQSRFHFALMPWMALYAAWTARHLLTRAPRPA